VRSALVVLVCVGCQAAAIPAPGVVHSDVATVTGEDGWAVNYPPQHKVFDMAGLLWVFYSDGESIRSTTTADGATWSAPQVVRSYGTLGHRIGLWFDGTHIHYAFATAETDGDVYYRRGVPGSDGTIAWDAPEQVAFAMPAGDNAMYPKVMIDSLGQPWIGFVLVKGGITTPPYDAVVTMSDATDGTWATGAGFPFTLVSDHESTYPDPAGVALSDGRMFWVYNRDDDSGPFAGRLYDNGWADEAAITETTGQYGLYSIAADGDDVDLVYRGGGALRQRSRAADGSWSSEVELDSSGSGHTSITLLGGGDMLVTWLDTGDDQVQFRERDGGAWGPTMLLADESAQALADKKNGINSNAIVEASDRWKAAVVYTTGTEEPYVLRFAGLPR